MKSSQIRLQRFCNKIEEVELKLEVHELPRLKSNEILINMIMMPINPSDINSLLGLYAGFKPKSFPAIPGVHRYSFNNILVRGVWNCETSWHTNNKMYII